MTVYTVSVLPGAILSFRVSYENRDCMEGLAQLKDDARKGKSDGDPSSVKDVSIDGYSEWNSSMLIVLLLTDSIA
jgi:hypothetical protein